MCTASGSGALVKLISCDNECFEVPRNVAERSGFVKRVLGETGAAPPAVPLAYVSPAVTLANVSGRILAKIIDYCVHVPAAETVVPSRDRSMSEWETEYCRMNGTLMYELIVAARYLEIRQLVDVLCMTLSDMIKGKTPSQIRATFNIEPYLTPEDAELLEVMRNKYDWSDLNVELAE